MKKNKTTTRYDIKCGKNFIALMLQKLTHLILCKGYAIKTITTQKFFLYFNTCARKKKIIKTFKVKASKALRDAPFNVQKAIFNETVFT